MTLTMARKNRRNMATGNLPWMPDGWSSVYVLEAGRAVKVGRSKNPAARAKGIQVSQAHPVTVFWAVWLAYTDAKNLESAIHKRLRQHTEMCASGEWYYVDPNTAVEIIKNEISERGYENRVDFQYGIARG